MLTYTNPTAILYGEQKWSVAATMQMYPDNDDAGRMNLYAASVSTRLGKHGLNVGYRYLGGLSVPTGEGNKTLEPADWTIDLAYSLRITDNFSAAVGASLVRSKVYKEATTAAFNVAAYYRNDFQAFGNSVNYVVGINAANMGPDLDYGKKYKKTHLPASFGAGGEIGTDFCKNHHLSVSLAGQYYCMPVKAKLFTANVGAEYGFKKLVFVRAGYRYGDNDYSLYSLGLGVSISELVYLNAAYQHGLGDNDISQKMLTLGVRF